MSKRTERQTIIDDEQIIELYWQRNENAIQETDKKYGQFLFRIAYNILHDRLDCEECQNDTYLDVWKAIPPTRPTVFPAFITKIMRRIALDRYKEKTAKRRIPSEYTVSMEDIKDTLHSNETVDSEYAAEELGKIISDYVRSLSDRQRYIFIDRFYLAEPVETMLVLLIMYIKSGDIGKSYSEYPFYIIVSFVSTGHFLALSKLTGNKRD